MTPAAAINDHVLFMLVLPDPVAPACTVRNVISYQEW
jgi:hypothetical protein